MSEENKTEVVSEEKETDLVLSKSYKFEGKTYDKIDFSGMEDITGKDMIEASRYMKRIGMSDSDEEMQLPYALYIAAKAAQMPMEFFEILKPYDTLKVKGRVLRFFFKAG